MFTFAGIGGEERKKKRGKIARAFPELCEMFLRSSKSAKVSQRGLEEQPVVVNWDVTWYRQGRRRGRRMGGRKEGGGVMNVRKDEDAAGEAKWLNAIIKFP